MMSLDDLRKEIVDSVGVFKEIAYRINGKKVKRWIKVNGASVPILEGEDDKAATERFVREKEGQRDKDKPKDKPKETESKPKEKHTFDKNGFDNTNIKITNKIKYSKTSEKKLAEFKVKYDSMSDEGKESNKPFYEFMERLYAPRNLDAIKAAWNKIPLENRANVKEFVLVRNKSKLAGSFEPKTKTLTINMGNNDKHITGYLEHEVAHSNFDAYPIAKQREWRDKTKHLAGVTPYSRDYAEGRKYNTQEHIEQIENALKTMSNLDSIDESNKYFQSMRNFNKSNGFTPESYKDGTVDKWFEDYKTQHELLHANENYAEFLRLKNADTADQAESTEYKETLKIYNEVFGND